MRRSSTILVLMLSLAVFGAAVHADDEAVAEAGEACACKPEDLQNLKNACQVQASELQKHIETLKVDLAASSSTSSTTQQELSASLEQLKTLQSELAAFQGKVTGLQDELSTTRNQLVQAQTEAKAAKDAAQASADQGSTCQRSLTKVESQLSEHAARLAELQVEDDAYLPAWLSRKMDSSFKYASDTWQQVQESEYAAHASKYAAQAATAVKPHWERVKKATAPAQEALSKLPISDTIAAAKLQVANIEQELKTVVKSVAASQPALSALNDPVALQLAVYSIMGLPMLLLFVVFVSIYGGPGKSSGTDTASKAGGKKATAATAAAGKKGAAAGGKAKAAVATPGGKGKGRAVRDGADVLYTP